MDYTAVLRNFADQRDLMEDRIQSGIEAHRKGWFRIDFTDPDGNPVTGAKVTVKQKTHAFRFGCNIFKLGCFKTDRENALYEERFKGMFNMATAPFYWSDFEPEDGMMRFEKDSPFIDRRIPPELVLEFCRENSIEVKGHPLFWQVMVPKWLPQDAERMKKYWIRRLEAIAERYDGVIDSFDVVNECVGVPRLAYEPKKNDTHYRNFVPLDGNYPEWAFRETERYFRKSRLVLNDTTAPWRSTTDELAPYYLLAENLLMKGAKIDTIGLQFHNFVKPEAWSGIADKEYNPLQLFRIMDCYARLGRPLSITEITIPGYDEEIQAELISNLYRIWFSHPAMESIIYWNLGDNCSITESASGKGWGEDAYRGGLFRNDFSKKPAFERLEDLIHHQWHTDLTLDTADDHVWFKAFYGDYEVTVERNGQKTTRELRLDKNGWERFFFEV